MSGDGAGADPATLDALRDALGEAPDLTRVRVPFGRTTPPTPHEWSAHCGGRFDRTWCIVLLHRHPRRGVHAQVRTHRFFDGLEMQMRTASARAALARGEMVFAPLDAANQFCAWPSEAAVAEARAHFEHTQRLCDAAGAEAAEAAEEAARHAANLHVELGDLRVGVPTSVTVTLRPESVSGAAVPALDLVLLCPGARVAPGGVTVPVPRAEPFAHTFTLTPLRTGALLLVAELLIQGDPVLRWERPLAVSP